MDTGQLGQGLLFCAGAGVSVRLYVAAHCSSVFHAELYVCLLCILRYGCGAAVCESLQEGEPRGRHVVIVDDLVQSGGTLIECHALLSSLGAAHGEPCCGTWLQYIAARHHGSS